VSARENAPQDDTPGADPLVEAEGTLDADGDGAGAAAVTEADPVEAMRGQLEALKDDLLRARAEFDNYRKRMHRERAELERRAEAGLLQALLPVLDNFGHAFRAMETGADGGGILEGVRMIHQQLLAVLEEAGLARIETRGLLFDPHVHEAVAREETSDLPPQSIVEELEPGYLFHGRVLKPARVRVAVPPSTPAGTPDPPR
jgi:molecular chaperone GrpE